MKGFFISGPVLAIAMGFGSPALAFSCPVHFGDAQAAIDNASAAMQGMTDDRAKGLVHTLIDDAKHLLSAAEHHHAKPAAGGYDHARSLAKADSAIAYANAAKELAAR